MSISLKELLGKHKLEELPEEHQHNVFILLERVNKVREKYGKPLQVSSGYRSMAEHLEIYKKKGITDPSKIPMKSKHLDANAVDFADPKQELQAWCLANVKFLEECQLWMEDFKYTVNWVHFQSVPYGSWKPGKSRFFIP